MPMYEDDDPGQVEEPEEEVEQEEPQLLAGKYKSAEELEHGYKESESAKTKAEQRAADLERELEQYRSKPATDNPADANDFVEKWNEQFYSNPFQAASQLMQAATRQALQTTKLAQANIKRQSARLKEVAAFRDVQDEWEAAMMQIPDEQLADANAAAQMADAAFRLAIGERVIRGNNAPQPQRPDVRDRQAQVRGLGVESPRGDAQDEGEERISASDRRMMEQMGYTSIKEQRAIARAAARRQRQDEDEDE